MIVAIHSFTRKLDKSYELIINPAIIKQPWIHLILCIPLTVEVNSVWDI